ncbi:hypothetical protein Mapa_003412 [Marchantia paleacea]|nr:hypothetical protein Mapa_003412 [Marchantia paleacea]
MTTITSGPPNLNEKSIGCAACRHLRRKCTPECVFAPYFPSNELMKFFNVHACFGASNVSKLLQDLPEFCRADAVEALVFEAGERVINPVDGILGRIQDVLKHITEVREEIDDLQMKIDYFEEKLQLSGSTSPAQAE